MKEKIFVWLERFLMLDVFVVIFSFIWFAIALIGRSLGLPLGWDIWYKLWQPVFNPAIGILFTGALCTWIAKLVRERFSKVQD